ncbi:MAG: WbuC family cupin fold metalloprotein [Proteobacteria bacterium]|nr:WbuC family cupin fold metalloprotein [Pseudomonadota bacterium]
MRLIDAALLDAISGEARSSPRLRRNRNFHPDNDFPAHRLLNAIEPGSYVAPHRHLDPLKDESMIVLRGRMGLVIFDDAGRVTLRTVIGPNAECCGVDIPHATWHTILALEPATVFFEAKAGPYLPLVQAECAPWAPAEGQAEAAGYLARLQGLFDEPSVPD